MTDINVLPLQGVAILHRPTVPRKPDSTFSDMVCMERVFLHSASGAQREIEASLLAILVRADETYQQDPTKLAPIQQALAALEAHRREDLMGIWAERAFAMQPNHPMSLFAMASHYDRIGHSHYSIPLWREYGRQAPQLDPLRLKLGNALLSAGNTQDALDIASHALATFTSGKALKAGIDNPEQYRLRFHMLFGEAVLRTGDVTGFAHNLAQLGVRIPHFPLPNIPPWSIEQKNASHLFITPVGGYGDQLLFSALIPQIAPHFHRVTIAVHPDLTTLLNDALPTCRVIATPSATRLNAPPSPEIHEALLHDQPTAQANMLSLPLLQAQLAPQLPVIFSPYLHALCAQDETLAKALALSKAHHPHKICVGLAWDRSQRYFPDRIGGTEACRTARTSLPISFLLELLEDAHLTEYIHFIALHEHGGARNWPAQTSTHLSIIPIESGNFAQTAQLIQHCDLVLSVDMSVANLASMMGTPTWVLLAREGDWRWGNSAPHSPWIPNARIFRQNSPGDWSHVLFQIQNALSQRVRVLRNDENFISA